MFKFTIILFIIKRYAQNDILFIFKLNFELEDLNSILKSQKFARFSNA